MGVCDVGLPRVQPADPRQRGTAGSLWPAVNDLGVSSGYLPTLAPTAAKTQGAATLPLGDNGLIAEPAEGHTMGECFRFADDEDPRWLPYVRDELPGRLTEETACPFFGTVQNMGTSPSWTVCT